jgi:hypothetical protein
MLAQPGPFAPTFAANAAGSNAAFKPNVVTLPSVASNVASVPDQHNVASVAHQYRAPNGHATGHAVPERYCSFPSFFSLSVRP